MRYVHHVAMAVLLTAATTAEAATMHAIGTFEVKMSAEDNAAADGVATGRMAVTKVFAGGLAASARGQMLTAVGTVAGSAAYVLIEQVSGTLDGKAGSFVLMHSATMDRGAPDQRITVVPDTGTGALAGLTGTMTMRIDGGVHHYDLAYGIAAQ